MLVIGDTIFLGEKVAHYGFFSARTLRLLESPDGALRARQWLWEALGGKLRRGPLFVPETHAEGRRIWTQL